MDELAASAGALALHRRPAIEQDPAGRRTLRLGAQHRPAERRPAPVGTAALSCAAAQPVHSGRPGAGAHQGRRRACGARRARARGSPSCRGCGCAGSCACRRPSRMRRRSARCSRGCACCLEELNARGPEARYTVDGDERRFRIGHRRGRDAWCASARRYSAAVEQTRETTMNNIQKTCIHRRRQHGRRLDRRIDQARPAERAHRRRRSERANSSRGWSATTASSARRDNAGAVADAEVVVLAVKPQQMRAVALALRAALGRRPSRWSSRSPRAFRMRRWRAGSGRRSRWCAPCRTGPP